MGAPLVSCWALMAGLHRDRLSHSQQSRSAHNAHNTIYRAEKPPHSLHYSFCRPGRRRKVVDQRAFPSTLAVDNINRSCILPFFFFFFGWPPFIFRWFFSFLISPFFVFVSNGVTRPIITYARLRLISCVEQEPAVVFLSNIRSLIIASSSFRFRLYRLQSSYSFQERWRIEFKWRQKGLLIYVIKFISLLHNMWE